MSDFCKTNFDLLAAGSFFVVNLLAFYFIGDPAKAKTVEVLLTASGGAFLALLQNKMRQTTGSGDIVGKKIQMVEETPLEQPRRRKP